jgi:hypothetical protein
MRQLAVQLEAGETERKAMKQGQENAARGDLWIGASVDYAACMSAQVEALVQTSRLRKNPF